jgi:TRAP-type C4-dicarboxylate transport system substrate-binding protein
MNRSVLALAALVTIALASPARADEPIQLKFGSGVPPQSWPNARGVVPWIKAVEEDTGGAIKFQLFTGGQVVTLKNAYDRMMNGVVDCIYGAFSEVTGTYKKATVPTIPFEAPKAIVASVALWRLYETGVIADEFAKVKPIALYVYNPSGIQTSRPIARLEDMKGIKLAVISRSAAQEVELLGATPVTMSPSEIYEALQRGLAAGAVLGWTGTQTFKLAEVTTYHLDVPFGNNSGFLMMSKTAYDKIPAAARKGLDKHMGLEYSVIMGRNSDQVEEESRAEVRAKPGHKISELTEEQTERWRKLLAPIADEWVKSNPDGAHVLAAYRDEVAKATKEYGK